MSSVRVPILLKFSGSGTVRVQFFNFFRVLVRFVLEGSGPILYSIKRTGRS
jgi:hypothetical protein